MEIVGDISSRTWEMNKVVQPEIEDTTTDGSVISSNNNNNNNNCELGLLDDNGNQSKEEDLNLGDTSNYSTEERNALFQQGQEHERNLKLNTALQCYLGCVQGLTNKNLFVHLPQCLQKISDIYRSQKKHNRAVHFAEAEKLLYDTTTIEADKIQKKIDEIAGNSHMAPTDLTELNIDALRAEEYEKLAKLCRDKKQYRTALKYAAQCTKLRQQIYGQSHEKTASSFSLFTALLAEIEAQKLQNPDSIDFLSMGDLDTGNESSESGPRTPEIVTSTPTGGEPVSILRQRSVDSYKETDREKKQVRFHESVEKNLRQREDGELTSMTMTFIQLAVCIVVLASLGMWMFCFVDRSLICQSLMSLFRKWVKTLLRYFYTWSGSRPPT